MIPEIGHAALMMALVTSLWQMLAEPFARLTKQPYWALCAKPLALCSFLLITGSFACLIASYLASDFSVLNVFENSHSLKPSWYKVTGSWGNHEGSMLLWLWVLTLYNALCSYTPTRDVAIRNGALTVLGGIIAAFSAFLLATSNPFTRIFPIPEDGQGLNPLLQDIGLILHPPILYLGYVGSAIVFAYAIAAMWQHKVGRAFAHIIRPWVLLCWLSLTAGIGLGGWWAYRELGWGGWWFWDPVENVALLPWLCATALLHSNLMLKRRGNFPQFTAFLAMLTFSMSLTGTFIVRSGLITSVHAFASASDRGIFMLLMIASIVLIGGIAFARMRLADAPSPYAFLSKQGLVMVACILLLSLAGTILLAILYPLILTLMGQNSISVGAPYFEAVFIPITLPLAALAALAPLSLFDHYRARRLSDMLKLLLPALVFVGVVASYMLAPASITALAALSLSGMLLLSLVPYVRKPAFSLENAATFLGHLGFAVMMAAVTINTQFAREIETPMYIGQSKTIFGYRLHLDDIKLQAHHNYFSRMAVLNIEKDGAFLARLTPETRYYPVRSQETTESAVHSTLWRDTYAVIGNVTYQPGTSTAQAMTEKPSFIGVRLYIMPAQNVIWLGFTLAIISGIIGIISHIRNRKQSTL